MRLTGRCATGLRGGLEPYDPLLVVGGFAEVWGRIAEG